MCEEDQDAVVSLQEVLEEDQHLEDTANAVLGDSDDTQCTYPKVHTCTILLWNKAPPTICNTTVRKQEKNKWIYIWCYPITRALLEGHLIIFIISHYNLIHVSCTGLCVPPGSVCVWYMHPWGPTTSWPVSSLQSALPWGPHTSWALHKEVCCS